MPIRLPSRGFWGLAVLPLMLAVFAGCGKSATPSKTAQSQPKEAVDPWPKAASALRKDPDGVVARRVFGELNGLLSANPGADQPLGLNPTEEAAVRGDLRLTETEATELRSPIYTQLDGHYLAECLYLRDVARSLDALGAPVPVRAKLAFDWVCRQLVLQPWLQPLTPIQALRRGAGSGLDRATTFSALCRQMDLELYFIGQAGASDWIAGHVPAGRTDPKGPFWAVGVREGQDLLLYDPWRGEPLPGPAPGRPATLGEVRANPDIAGAWLDNAQAPWDVTRSDLKAGEPYLATPLSSVAGRMRILEAKLKSEIGVKVFVDLAAGKTAVAIPGTTVRVWSPPNDPFCTTRVLMAYTPSFEGGLGLQLASGGLGGGATLTEALAAEQFPRKALMTVPSNFTQPEAVSYLGQLTLGQYRETLLKPPTPRERIQRGQFVEVTQWLVKTREEYGTRAERVRVDSERTATVVKFAAEFEAYLTGPVQTMRNERRPPAEIDGAINGFFKAHLKEVATTLDGPLSEAVIGELTYLLALSTHERAERALWNLLRLDEKALPKTREDARRAAKDAWAVARDWWSQYDAYAASQNEHFAGRAAHAKKLSTRVNTILGGL